MLAPNLYAQCNDPVNPSRLQNNGPFSVTCISLNSQPPHPPSRTPLDQARNHRIPHRQSQQCPWGIDPLCDKPRCLKHWQGHHRCHRQRQFSHQHQACIMRARLIRLTHCMGLMGQQNRGHAQVGTQSQSRTPTHQGKQPAVTRTQKKRPTQPHTRHPMGPCPCTGRPPANSK